VYDDDIFRYCAVYIEIKINKFLITGVSYKRIVNKFLGKDRGMNICSL